MGEDAALAAHYGRVLASIPNGAMRKPYSLSNGCPDAVMETGVVTRR
jgi:hypothetical protein